MTAFTRKLPVLTALVVAAIVAVLASAFLVRLIEKRSLYDVTQILRLSGHDWAQVSVDGLQVHVAGIAPSEAVRFRALTAAATVVDSARVIDHINVTEKTPEAPRFSIEILRNEDEISLIGLIPGTSHQDLIGRVRAITGVEDVGDLVESADHPVPEGWNEAVSFALDSLALLPRSKISITAGEVSISAISDSAEQQRRLETDISRAAPDGLRLELDISAPRPAITPFTLRFLIDTNGRAKFDACSADTAEARTAIVQAAVAAGMKGKASCIIGLGAPSPRWGEATARAIRAVGELGGGSVTFSDADVSLVAPDTTPKDKFDAVVGRLEQDLPDAFSLHAVLTEPVKLDGSGAGDGPPEFVATFVDEGVQIRGRIGDERDRAVIGGFARALFGASHLADATRLDDDLPENWPIRVMAALEAMKSLESGGVVVQPDFVSVHGTTGLPDASAEIARLLSSKLGEGAHFEIDVSYDEKLDPVLGLPTPEECVANINAAIAENKISFAPGSADIEPGAGPTLDKIAGLMKDCTDFPMEIGGHTDSQGREEMNQALSQSRAGAVIDALLSRRVLTSNLSAKGYGESTPIADNDTEEGREANRRIEFTLVSAQEEAAQGEAAAAEDTDEAPAEDAEEEGLEEPMDAPADEAGTEGDGGGNEQD